MATRQRDFKIHLKGERAKLQPRREPYWRHIDVGRHVGYRKTENGSETWIARYTTEDRKFRYQKLGTLAAIESFTDARRRAEEWFEQCDVGVMRTGTVEEACRDYVDNRRVEVSEGNAIDAEKRFKAHVYDTPFAKIKLDKLSLRAVEKWRNDLLTKTTPQNAKRNLTTLKAALNLAYRRREVASADAWKHVSVADGESRNELDFYWSVAERRAFLEKCPADLKDFLTAISYTGARPQELAQAKVEDFDLFARKLILRTRKGGGSKLRSRDFSLANDAAFEFFKRMAADKLPKTPLMTRSNGNGWYTGKPGKKPNPAWEPQVRKIRRKHNFDERLSAYHFRHWTLTDWLNNGIVAANVATMAGTSITMLDQYYKKFVKGHVHDQLRGIETI